jgi:hypothetical protein
MMPKYKITGPDGQSYEVNAPDGASQDDVLAYAQRSFKMAAAPKQQAPSKPFGQQLNDAVADVPRQIGLTARYGLEGVGGAFDSLVGNPLRTLAAPILGNQRTADTGGALADLLSLPKPQTAQERVVGDAARTLAGGAVPLGAAGALAGRTSGVAQAVARTLAANPAQQLASAAAAGGAGGYTRETGGDDTSQLIASLAAGVAAPAGMAGAQRAAGTVARRFAATPAQSPQQIDITINNALQSTGLRLEDLQPKVAQSIRNDVAAAFRTDNQVSPDAVQRLADYRLTGLTPTAAGLTLDPAVVTQQKNLAKLGINSKDAVAQQLGHTQNRNNGLLIDGLNNLGAGAADDAIGGANRIMSALHGVNESEQNAIGALYGQARDNAGRSAPLDPSAFTQRAGDLLHDANVESFLTPDVRNKLNGFADGSIPLNVEIAEQFKTGIGRLQRNASDGNVRHALGLVRQALDETPLMSAPAAPQTFGGNQLTVPGALGAATPPAADLGQDAIDAFTRARGANREWMQTVEKTPALQAIRDGVEPDKFVQQFIVGSGNGASVMATAQLKNLIKGSPDAMDAVREQIAAHLKAKALSGAADEVGNFSQSGYNKALNAIGDRKLNLFFDPNEVAQLKALGRVASYEQFQPAGSAVNNSNTAGAGAAIAERVLKNLPFVSPFLKNYLAEPIQTIKIGNQAARSLDVPSALTIPGTAAARASLLQRAGLSISPASLLLPQSEDDKR